MGDVIPITPMRDFQSWLQVAKGQINNEGEVEHALIVVRFKSGAVGVDMMEMSVNDMTLLSVELGDWAAEYRRSRVRSVAERS